MKKLYTKPKIVFDSFELSESIAAGCGNVISNPASGTCGLEIPGIGNVFISADTGCDFTDPDGEFQDICYHVPVDTSSLFNS